MTRNNDRQDACPTGKVGGLFMVGQASCLSFSEKRANQANPWDAFKVPLF